MSRRNPNWRFAPTMGGAEQGANPGQQHFARKALSAMVRETLQNSLDHHEDGLPPVEVSYQIIQARPEDIGARDLKEHIQACLEEIQDDPNNQEWYRMTLRSLQLPQVSCMAIIDTNTTGLQGENWNNLILREGVPTPGSSKTKGGSFGFGKNAPFNLADAGAVIYSTRYLDTQARRGKIEQMMGRAQLRTHTTPDGERRQGTGFLAVHDNTAQQWNQPLRGPEIPDPFRLKERGTGVFITGFQQEKHPDWEQEITQAAVTQFFAAILQKQLIVRAGENRIDHSTLEEEIQNLPPDDPTRHYRLALDEESQETVPSGRLAAIGAVKIWLRTDPEAPRRLAHINRRGMLITSSRELEDNPLCPQRTGQWSPWCAVTMAADEQTDAQLRRMEPPAHDALQPGQLRDRSGQEQAARELSEQRTQIRELLRKALDDANRRGSDNVDELARLFPKTSRTKGRDLEYREKKLQSNSDQPIDTDIAGSDPGGKDPGTIGTREAEDGTREAEDGTKEAGDGNAATDNGAGNQRVTAQLRNTRIVRSSPRNLAMAFTMPRDADCVRYGLRAAGEQYQRNEKPIAIQEVVETGDLTASARLEDGEIVVEALPNTRVSLMISLRDEDQEYLSYRLAVRGENQ